MAATVNSMGRYRLAWSWSIALALGSVLALACVGCGAKTPLEVPDSGPRRRTDASVLNRTARCYPLRIRTRVGNVVSLRPDAEIDSPSGYTWSLAQRPAGSQAVVFSDGSPIATLTPDREGEYDVTIEIPSSQVTGGVLTCTITVLADPADPVCPGYSIPEPRAVTVPGGDLQVALDVIFHDPRVAQSGAVGAVVADETDTRVSVLVLERPVASTASDPAAQLSAEGETAEQAVHDALSATDVLIGRLGQTYDGRALRRSTLRVTGSATTSGALRDRALARLAGLSPPGYEGQAQAQATEFYVEVATGIRTNPARTIVLVAVSPATDFDDSTQMTAIRVNDFANATGLSNVGAVLEPRCHEVTATRSLMADFLWLVDTSGSMSDDQERVGSTAQRFFADLNAAGVDFRVGVFQAGNAAPQLEGTLSGRPFRWISGTDPTGAQMLAWQVTEQAYQSNSADRFQPFRVSGQQEEPIAASIEVIREFERRRAIGETNPEFLLRPQAALVVFLVTDEPGSNDYNRYFNQRGNWGSTPAEIVANVAQFYRQRGVTPFGLVPPYPDSTCGEVEPLCRCVISRGGGAFVPITVPDSVAATQVQSAMARIVSTVAGAASEFVLPTSPVSATLRVRVARLSAPRSRADGFDYEEASRALVFRGATYRPRVGDLVRAGYLVWCDPATAGSCN